MAATIGETVQQLHDSLRDYIEATYHVSHPTLVTERQQILQAPGVIHQQPYFGKHASLQVWVAVQGARPPSCSFRSVLGGFAAGG